MGESTGEPAEGAKEQSDSREQLSGQALGMEKVGDKRPTTTPVEALSDAPKEDSPEQPSRVRITIIVQLNKELEMLKEMNDKNAKQANKYKEKYYGASSKAKRLTEEASKWFNFQEEVMRLEAERDSTVNKLQNDLATALKKQAAYAKRKDCPKEDVLANKKTIELIGRMIEEAKQDEANFCDHAANRSAKNMDGSKDTLASLYRPPFTLVFQGSFEQAKVEVVKQATWLLINLQSNTKFASYTLNRDTWAHLIVKDLEG
ncbi:hypothetical protein L7F22_045956 [Adiantum nelumboides]|nr:hypothetical protein [Adiantum nelumboides]